jgi:acetolactate synthase regulatory subunit
LAHHDNQRGFAVRKINSSVANRKKEWSWSLNLASYDRCFKLSPTELSELQYWSHHNGRGFGILSDATVDALQRLVQPINETISTIDFLSPYDGRLALQLMLLEMHRRRTSFWSWSFADWRETIGKNHHDFQQRFDKEQGRQHLLAIAYVLLEFMDFWELRFEKRSLATKVFGQDCTNATIERVLTALREQGYKVDGNEMHQYRAVTCEALLSNRSPYLEDLTEDSLDLARKRIVSKKHQQSFVALSVALERLGILERPIYRMNQERRAPGSNGAMEGIAMEWSELCLRWFHTSTLAYESRSACFYKLLLAGRWLAKNYPDITHPIIGRARLQQRTLEQ